ncbi:transposase domain-containing protein [Ruminococcus bovis]|nr:transposase domain-containing protein [Ruminococcus bovis]
MYSIIETAKENNLNPFRYLTYIFKKFPNIKENETADILLPWNAPEECKVKI